MRQPEHLFVPGNVPPIGGGNGNDLQRGSSVCERCFPSQQGNVQGVRERSGTFGNVSGHHNILCLQHRDATTYRGEQTPERVTLPPAVPPSLLFARSVPSSQPRAGRSRPFTHAVSLLSLLRTASLTCGNAPTSYLLNRQSGRGSGRVAGLTNLGSKPCLRQAFRPRHATTQRRPSPSSSRLRAAVAPGAWARGSCSAGALGGRRDPRFIRRGEREGCVTQRGFSRRKGNTPC